MSHKFLQRLFSVFLLLGLMMSAVSPVAAAPVSRTSIDKETPISIEKPADQSSALTPTVVGPFSPVDTTGMGPVSSILPVPSKTEPSETPYDLALPKALAASGESNSDPVVDNGGTSLTMPAPIHNFEGVNNLDGVYPPDTDGDIGPDNYIQMVNFHLAIYDNEGNLLYGPFLPNTLWPGADPCGLANDGDVVTLYDQFANRWLLSQFRFPNYPAGPYYECVAVSKGSVPTNDPNDWYLYTITASNTKMNDYPKLAVWPDAYYMTANQFTGGSSWGGAGVWALDRAKMLNGQPFSYIYFDLYPVNSNYGGMLPVDVDGSTLPPEGTPGYYVEVDDSTWIPPNDAIRLWEFHVDWNTPANSTFGLGGNPNATIDVANFNPLPCTTAGSRNCVPQPGTSQKLDAIGDRLMFRAVYRNFGDHEAIAMNHTVLARGTDVAGIRWYELRDPGGTPTLYQQGTFAPDDGLYRWMGSLAFDHVGNLALGYSVSSSSIYPSIRYTGRLVNDPLGEMNQGEASVIVGSGSQTGTAARWGDYSAMAVDPVDDCTFWYTQEYIQTTGTANWQTRVASFKFPNCSTGPMGTLAGTVKDANTLVGIGGATIEATLSPTQTFTTSTLPDGTYGLTLPVGTYEVTASAYGYNPATVSGIQVIVDATTTQNFFLYPAAVVTVDGTVTDANTDWPLYAKITIDGYPGDPLWTDPVTGHYSVDLVSGITYTFNVEAFVAGYLPHSEDVKVNTSMTKDFALDVDEDSCVAPGYQPDFVYFQDFEANDGGFTTSGTTSWQWGVPTSGPGTAHSGQNVWATNLSGNYNNDENGYITSPAIDLSSQVGKPILVTWWQWLRSESNYDFASVEVSKNGGVNWTIVYPEVSGQVDLVWAKHSVALDQTYAVANFMIRFHFRSDFSNVYPGWYVDNIGIGGVDVPPPTLVYTEDFEATDGGFTHSGTNDQWQWGTPTTLFPTGCGSGIKCWGTHLAGNYLENSNQTLLSPLLDLSAVALPPGFVMSLNWLQAYHIETSLYDHGYAEVSINGGAWQTMWQNPSNSNAVDWTSKSFDISTAAGGNAQFRFRLTSDSSVNYEGLYIDNVIVSYAEPIVYQVACLPQPGGLVVGNVYDANTLDPMVGATVANDTGGETTTVANPEDLEQAPAFYTLFSPAQYHLFTAAYNEKYGSDEELVNVLGNDTVGQDFQLPAGVLTYTPPKLEATVDLGASTSLPLTLSNDGGRPVSWELKELDKGMVPFGPIQTPDFVVRSFRQGFLTTDGLGLPPQPDADPFGAGDIIQSWPTGLAYAWGLGFDQLNTDVWLGNIGAGGGDDLDYRFLTDGTNTGDTIDTSGWVGDWAADMAFNITTGMLWQLNVGGDNCIHELDPVQRIATGNVICPGFAVSQRGLAYDPSTDTYFAGGWNDHMIYRFTGDGSILSAVDIGVDIAGLAYNSTTAHLFVMSNANPNPVYVVDVANEYTIIGQFSIPGFPAYGGAGFEMSCDGHLWAVDQDAQMAYEVESGETTSMCGQDVTWLSENPITGTLNIGADQIVQVGFDASVPEVSQPGEYHAQLKINHDTPYYVANVPITMTVEAPATYGKLKGTITGLGYCDADPAPLAGAEVFIEGLGGYTATLQTDDNGYYQIWLDQAHSPLTISVTAAEHQLGTRSGVMITGGQTNTQNFDLRLLEPCMSTDPTALEVIVAKGYSLTVPLELINTGAISTGFEINEVPGGLMEPSQTPLSTEPRQVVLSVGNIPGSGAMTDVPAAPEGAISLVLDDGSAENSIGVNSLTAAYQFIWLNRFTPAAGDFPFNLNQIQVLFPAGQATVGDSLDLVVYQDANSNPADGATLLATYHVTVLAANGTTWSVYDLPDPLPVTGPGDVLIGAINRWVVSGIDPPQYPASIDQTASQVRSWVGWWNADPPDPALLPPDSTFGTIDSQGYPGNWLIRGYGETGAADVPWLAEDPVAGIVAADGIFDVAISFDSMTYTIGMYEASLSIKTDDPVHPNINIPVVMQVVNPAMPVASFTSDSPVLIGDPMVFTNNSYPGSPEATEFEWDFGDGITQTVSTLDPVAHTYATFGSFHVTLTVCNVVGCSTDDADVFVLAKLVFMPMALKH